jgi:TPR repeat protein
MKKPDPWWIIALEVTAVVTAVGLAYYSYYYFDHLHYHVARGYAHLGYPEAQHVVGQRLLFGKGVERNPHHAMEWFKKAADQGHPHAAYNVALGHIKGIRTDLLESGESHRLIQHAASKGVHDARLALQELCSRGKCT